MGDNDRNDIARHAAAVARELLGPENKHLSSKDELRFGNHGSLSVDLETGQVFDHQSNEGGGVLWLIERETGQTVEGGNAVAWMREHGFDVEDRDRPPASAYERSSGSGGGDWVPPGIPEHAKLTAAYPYHAADGSVAFEVVRYDWDDPESEKGHSKDFRQRQPDPSKKHGYSWKVKGLTPLPYRLPELLEAIAAGDIVFVVEGEKAAEKLRELGAPATTNSGGAGKFPEELIRHFAGGRVVVLPDNDPQAKTKDGRLRFHPDGAPVLPGQDHGKDVATKLMGTAAEVKYLELPGLPLKGDVVDWLEAGHTLDELYDLASRAPRFGGAPFRSKFAAVTWGEMDAPGPQFEHLIKGILTRGDLSMFAGESKAGKTFAVLDMAMAVARGVDWFGFRVLQGGVVYCAPESPTGVRRKRIPAYRRHHGVGLDQAVPFVLLPHALDLANGDQQTDDLIEEIRHWERAFGQKVELVVIDTFSKATPGLRENESSEVSKVLDRCERIRIATGAHVLLVHHLNAEGNKLRGHTSIFANLESVLIARKLDNQHDADGRPIREITLEKVKDGVDGKRIRFVLQSVEIGVDGDGDAITSCVIQPPAGSAAAQQQSDFGVTVGGNTAAVLRVIYDAVEAVGAFAPAEMKLPFGTQIVDRKEIGARLARYLAAQDDADPADADDPEAAKRRTEARRKQVFRAREMLFTKGIIGFDENWIWLTGKRVRGFGPPPGTPSRTRRDDRGDAPPANDATGGPGGGPLPFDE